MTTTLNCNVRTCIFNYKSECVAKTVEIEQECFPERDDCHPQCKTYQFDPYWEKK